VTKKKVAGKNKDHRNRTAHQLAMADAKVRKALSMLQSNWNSLSPQERNERLNNLAELNCSARGIAEETGIPLTTIRRYINLARDEAYLRERAQKTKRNDFNQSCR
jgi:DNA-directed RNA polymerase specialized sigma24 family protein